MAGPCEKYSRFQQALRSLVVWANLGTWHKALAGDAPGCNCYVDHIHQRYWDGSGYGYLLLVPGSG